MTLGILDITGSNKKNQYNLLLFLLLHLLSSCWPCATLLHQCTEMQQKLLKHSELMLNFEVHVVGEMEKVARK